MRLENYEYVKSWCTPTYWYEEGNPREEYWVDTQNMFYHKFCEDLEDEDGNEIEDTRKYYVISPYKPIGVELTKENSKDLIKWCVEMCYLDNGSKEYEFYEWDFENHCIKE